MSMLRDRTPSVDELIGFHRYLKVHPQDPPPWEEQGEPTAPLEVLTAERLAELDALRAAKRVGRRSTWLVGQLLRAVLYYRRHRLAR